MNQIISTLLIGGSLIFNGGIEKEESPLSKYLPIEVVNIDIFNELKEIKRLEAEHNNRVKEILIQRKLEKERLEELEILERLKKEEESKWKTFKATHYSPLCPTGCIGITATGYDVRNTIYYNGMRVIAVDPRVIPLYSIVEVEYPYGNFKAVAIDTGGAIKNYKIDILVESEKKAYTLGKFDVKIKIIGKLK